MLSWLERFLLTEMIGIFVTSASIMGSLRVNGPLLQQEEKPRYLTKTRVKRNWKYKILDFRKWVRRPWFPITRNKSVLMPFCVTMTMITEDIWVLMKDFLWCQSIKLIHTCQKNELKRAIVVVWFPGFGVLWLVMGLWMTAGPLIVSSALLRPPMSQSERRAYSTTDTHHLKIAHKGQMTRLMHGDDSVNTPENENHFNLFSWKKRKKKEKSSSATDNSFHSCNSIRSCLRLQTITSRPHTFPTFE